MSRERSTPSVAEGRCELVTSNDAGSRLAAAQDWLISRGRSSQVLVVGASRLAADDLVRRATRVTGSSFGWVRTTLPQLATELALPELARRGLAPIGSAAAEALTARVLHQLRQENRLGELGAVAGGPGLARALSATVQELRHSAVPTDLLREVAPALATVLESYAAELTASGLIDRPGVLETAADLISDAGFNHPWLKIAVLLLDVRASNLRESRLVGALGKRSSQVLATAPAADDHATERLAATLEVRESRRLAETSGDVALNRLQRNLFGQAQVSEAMGDESVAILSAPGEARECVEIARRSHELARSGVRFDRIAIALRSAEEYVPHLEEALGRAGVPVFYARGVARPHPAGRAFVALLDCALEGLSTHRFAEYVSLAQVPGVGSSDAAVARNSIVPSSELLPVALAQSSVSEVAEEIVVDEPADHAALAGNLRTPRRWERLLSDAAVIGGIDRWRRRLDGAKGRLEVELAACTDVDDPARDRIAADLGALRDLRNFALPLVERLSAWPEESTWREWLDRLRELAATALKCPESVLALLAELEPLAPIGPVRLEEVRLVLARRLLAVAVAPTGSRYGRVLVAPIEALRGLTFDVVFVPGLAERMFPRKIAEDPILLDSARREISAALATNEDRLSEERYLLQTAAGAACRRVVLSYPRLDLSQGRPRVPSFYALEALRAAEGRLPTFDELSSRAERASEARVGWPAPARPENAIDEAEHDLALLENLRSRDEEEKVGAARYLLTANPHLGRALRFRARRWLRSWTVADGLVRPSEAARNVMTAHRLEARSFSPTALEKYAACPYQFFLYAVHRLAPREVADVVEDLDPLRRGSLVHETQFALLSRLRAEDLLPIDSENLAMVRDILDACLDEQAALLRDQLLPRIERVWLDSVENIRADMREWLRLCSIDESGYVPWRFELAFGLEQQEGRDADSVEDPARLECGIHLRGSIDLVERRADGRLRATDHKTGKARMPARGVIAGGTGLQPVLYALALERLYPDALVDGGRLYYCTSAGSFEEREIALDKSARQSALEVARVVGEALETPFLPARPSRGACEWCDYQVVCGPYEETRTARKPRRGVDRLEYLRSLP